MLCKYSLFAILTLILCLLVTAPTFAYDNQTDNITSNDNSILQATHYYFDVNNTEEGNGTEDNPYNQLNNLNLVDNSIIHFASGEYKLFSSKSFNNIVFCGNSHESILDFNNYTLTNSKTMSFINITLKNVKIENLGSLTSSNTIFKDSGSESKEFGGAISSQSHDIYLNNCEFRNITGRYGGVIYISNAKLEITNTLFENNHALIFGGVITSVKSDIRLNNVTAKNNKADFEGGVVYSFYGNFSAINSTFTNNTARTGGALYIDNNTQAFFINNTFLNNSASKLAGALYSLANLNTTFSNNTFINNDFINTTIPSLVIGNSNYTMYMYNHTAVESIPVSYDLRDWGYVTSVKAQGSGGNCWSFALLAALESCILKAGGENFDLSEENVKNLMATYSDYGWNHETNNGGVDDMGIGYLISWLGPVFESDDVYSPTSILSPVLNSILHVQNVIVLKRDNYTDNDGIKKAILHYGGVATAIKWSGSSVKGNARYYSGSDSSDHAVTIIGWDDNYSKDNFAKKPAGDGAWIIKNSHGSSSGSNGYWYVSYYDTRCAQVGRSDVSYTFILNDTIKYDKNYQYDVQGKTDYFLNESDTVWYKNIFTSTDSEYLAAVSTHFEKVSNYTIYINVNSQLKHTQNGTTPAGYYTINLNELIPLQKGDVFEVIFKITTDGEASFPISEKVSLIKYTYTDNISFLSYDGENWTDLYNLTWKYSTHTYNSQVACIKAFTVLNKINTTLNLTYNITNTVTIKAEVFNQYGYHVNGGSVIFNVNGINHTVSGNNGVFNLVLERQAGDYNVVAIFKGDGYNSSQNSISFSNPKINTNITLNITDKFNPVNITAIVMNQEGYPVLEGDVIINLDGESFTQSIEDGKITFIKVFKRFGIHSISVYYNGTSGYNKSNSTQVFDVYLKNTNITLNVSGEYNPVNLSVKVVDEFGENVAGNITLKINSKYYYLDLDKGTASLTHVFDTGTNTISVIYNENCYYNSSSINRSINVNPTIISSDSIKTYNSRYSATFLNSSGEPLINSEVSFTILSNTYNVKTDSNGVAAFEVKLNPGQYSVFILNPKTSDTKTQIINVVSRISQNSDLEMYFGADKYYKVMVCDDDGNYKAGIPVVFTINNVQYTVLSNDKGYASLKLNLGVGSHKISAEFKEFKVSNKITVKTTLITKNIKVKKGKTIKFTAKLLNTNGKILKGKKVTFKFKGKTYKVKTNKKGIATLKITKKYKAGKYKIVTSYSKLKITNTIRIKH